MRYNKRPSILWLIVLAVLLAGCNKKNGSAKSVNNSFYRQIDNSFPRKVVKPSGYVNQPLGAAVGYMLVDPVHGYLITNNYKKESIQLYDKGGDSLLFTTGRKGKGPGEFLSISQLSIGYNGALYVMDGTLYRVTKFKIEHGQLQYITSFLIKPPPGMHIMAIYVTKYGNFCVFDRYYNPKTSEQNYYFYRLDDTFTPVKQVLELPGTQ